MLKVINLKYDNQKNHCCKMLITKVYYKYVIEVLYER